MKICPKCGKENSNNSEYCKFCGTKLSITKEDFKWVVIATTENQFEADIIKNLLEANGIDVMIKRPGAGIGGSSMLSNPLMGSAGAWNVYVAQIDMEKAEKLLNKENILEEEDDGTP